MSESEKNDAVPAEGHALEVRRVEVQVADSVQAREAFLAGQLTERTRAAYRQDLEAFFRFAGVRRPEEITAGAVTSWRNAMMAAGARPATVARKLTALRAFCEHLVYHGILEKNPADPKIVKAPRVSGASRTHGLTAGQAERLLEGPDRSTVRGSRDYAILKWLLHLGLRREELCRVRLSDLGEERGYRIVRVAGKGGKDRVIPLQEGVWRSAIEYLEKSGRPLGEEGSSAALFAPTRNNRTGKLEKALDPRTVWQIVTRWVKRAGIRKHISPHSLRHTSITLALDGGATLRQAQTFAGHADPKTTVRYDRTREDLDNSAAHLIHLETD